MTFDFDAFVDGYVEAALWADCLPACEYVVGVTATCKRLAAFATHDEASEYISTLPDHLDGIYYLDGPENGESGGREHLELREGCRDRMIERGQLREFVAANYGDLLLYCGSAPSLTAGLDEAHAGHDFWLTRNCHGAGFWDRGLGALGDRLTEACKTYGSADDHTPFDCGDGTADC